MRRIVILAGLLVALSAAAAVAGEALRPGTPAPAVTVDDLRSGRLTLGAAAGARARLLVFWATWSATSAEVLERVQRLAAGPAGASLGVVAVNVEAPAPTAEDLGRVRATVARLGLTVPVGVDRGLEAFHAYGVVAVPSSILIGADGTVVATLAAYPIAGRDPFFDLVEATALGRPASRPSEPPRGPQPAARAVRYYSLGRALVARGLVEQAATHLRRAVEADPAYAAPRVLLAQVLRERAAARGAVRAPGTTVETVHRGQAERAAALSEAERILGEALALDPANPGALTELALIAEQRGDQARARELIERALVLDAEDPAARSHRGALLVRAGDLPAGRADLAAAIALNPLDWRLHVTAAEAYEARGLQPDALAAYRRGVELLWQLRREGGAGP